MTLRRELRDLLMLAVPLAISQIGMMLMTLTDSVMMGRLSADSLAAGGLAGNVAITLILIPQGLLMAMQPVLAQLRGAGGSPNGEDGWKFSRTLAAAFLLALLASIPIILLLTQIDSLLSLTGTAPNLAAMALDYEKGFIWAVPAALWQVCCRFYLSAMERPRIIMVTIIVACIANGFFNWILIWGHFGLPAFGLRGSAYATALSCWGMAIALTLYSVFYRLFPAGLLRIGWDPILSGMGELLAVGWPIAGSVLVEIGLFTVSTLLMSRFGAVALAAHQICLGISSVTFMVPMAIGQASTVRVGFHIGGGQPRLARQAGFLSLGLGIAFMALAAASLRLSAAPIIRLFISADDPQLGTILTLGKQLIALAALFQIFDGAQAVASGALRGLRDTRATFLAAALGYWGIGLPLGLLLAFGLDWGPTGLWWGFVVGLALVSTLLCWRFSIKSKARCDEGDRPQDEHGGPQIHLAIPHQTGEEQRQFIGE